MKMERLEPASHNPLVLWSDEPTIIELQPPMLLDPDDVHQHHRLIEQGESRRALRRSKRKAAPQGAAPKPSEPQKRASRQEAAPRNSIEQAAAQPKQPPRKAAQQDALRHTAARADQAARQRPAAEQQAPAPHTAVQAGPAPLGQPPLVKIEAPLSAAIPHDEVDKRKLAFDITIGAASGVALGLITYAAAATLF